MVQQKLAQYIAEARGLRAVLLFQPCQDIRSVVIIGEDAIAPDAGLSAVQLARKPWIAVYSILLRNSTWPQTTFRMSPQAPTGRISKSVMMAYKAQLYLMAASPLFNGNPVYASMKNPTTEHGVESSDPQTAGIQQLGYAAAAAKAFIDKYVPGTFDLYKEFGWRRQYRSLPILQGCDVYGLE